MSDFSIRPAREAKEDGEASLSDEGHSPQRAEQPPKNSNSFWTRALRLLRLWRQGSLLAGTDVTWGAAAAIAGALGIDCMDIEGSEAAALALEGSPAARLEEAGAAWERTLQASAALEQSALFREAGRSVGDLRRWDASGRG